jgi:hypothetical protein
VSHSVTPYLPIAPSFPSRRIPWHPLDRRKRVCKPQRWWVTQQLITVRFDISMMATTNDTAFWATAACNMENKNQIFRETLCFHPKIEGADIPETSSPIAQTIWNEGTWHGIPEGINMQQNMALLKPNPYQVHRTSSSYVVNSTKVESVSAKIDLCFDIYWFNFAQTRIVDCAELHFVSQISHEN